MEKRLAQKLGNFIGLMAFGFMLFLGFYHFSQRFASQHSIHNQPTGTGRANAVSKAKRSVEAANGRYVLHLDQGRTVGKANLIYRGLEKGSLCLIDVIIPDLDPERPYRYRLDIETAEKGFRMAGRNFKLEAAGKKYIRLVETVPGRK